MEAAALSVSAPLPGGPQLARIERAAEEFEALVLAELLAPLFTSVETPAVAGGGGRGEKVFSSLLTHEYAGAIARRGGFGLADAVKASLIDLQAAQSAPRAGESR